MSMLREWATRLWGTLSRRREDRDLEEELRLHLELAAEDARRHGCSPDDALRAARLRAGGMPQAMEALRDQRGWPVMDTIQQDVRFAARLLLTDRWLTLTAVVALALGIGTGNTVFTIVNAVLLRPLPFERPERILFLGTRDGLARESRASYLDFRDWRDSTRAFAGMAAYSRSTATVREGGQAPEQVNGLYVSANAFGLLGVKPVLGRDFREEDDRSGAAAVAILGSGLWKRRYGGRTDIVGQTIIVNDLPAVVVGVMPDGFEFDWFGELWQPLAQRPELANQRRDARELSVFGRLSDGVSVAQARADLSAIAVRLARDHPDTNRDIESRVVPFDEELLGSITHPIFLALLSAAGFVLLIACANVANLLLARSARRAREIAIRTALGASRGRIVRQLLVESVLLALLAGILGLGLSALGVQLVAARLEENMPYWVHLTMDHRVFGFLAALCLGTAVLFGLAPAIHAAKTNVNETLKEGGPAGTAAIRARRWTSALIIGEVALTLSLLAGAGLLLRTFLTLYRSDKVIDTSNLTVSMLRLSEQTYAAPEQRLAFYRRLEQRLRSIPQVSAAMATALPFTGVGVSMRQVAIDGRSPTLAEAPTVSTILIGRRYFETLGVRLLRGRAFGVTDGTVGRESAIVNELFARRFFPDADPIGRRIRLAARSPSGAGDTWATIVGVSPTVRQTQQNAVPVVYVPHRTEAGASAFLFVRGGPGDKASMSRVRKEMRAIDPSLALGVLGTMDDVLGRARLGHALSAGMLTIFAAIGLVLASVGLYSVTSYSVTRRTHELGIRMALGARAADVRWLVLRQAALQVTVGLVIGLAAALALGRVLQSFLVEVGPRDPVTLISIAALLVLVSLVACLVPARRATRLDPAVTLRSN